MGVSGVTLYLTPFENGDGLLTSFARNFASLIYANVFLLLPLPMMTGIEVWKLKVPTSNLLKKLWKLINLKKCMLISIANGSNQHLNKLL